MIPYLSELDTYGPYYLENCLRLPITLVLSLMLLSCAHHEPPGTDSARAQPIEVREEGTWRGEPYVKLTFRSLLTNAARERLTPEEARVFVEAMEEALESTEWRAALWVSHPSASFNAVTEVDPGAGERWRRALEEYTNIYGSPDRPLPGEIAEDRFATAFMLSTKYMPDGARAGAAELFSSKTVVAAIIAAGLTYLTLWLAPEPVFTKSTATAITVTLMAIYGVSEIINLSKAFMRFCDEVTAATTMAELEAAAQRFGESMGQAGVRIMTMVAGGVASRAAPYASLQNLKSLLKIPTMVAARTPQGQVVLVPVAEATATAVDVAKGTAVLMGVSAVATTMAGMAATASARTTGDCRPESDKGNARKHHIATDKNRISDANGGPWTQRFEELFAQAGMSLQDPANIVYLMAHQGPHPEAYHQEVYERLALATSTCRGATDCRSKLTAALDSLAAQVCKRGSKLNSLLVR